MLLRDRVNPCESVRDVVSPSINDMSFVKPQAASACGPSSLQTRRSSKDKLQVVDIASHSLHSYTHTHTFFGFPKT